MEHNLSDVCVCVCVCAYVRTYAGASSCVRAIRVEDHEGRGVNNATGADDTNNIDDENLLVLLAARCERPCLS